MEYRPVVVRGSYDVQNEVVLRNQVYNNQPGYHLLTPLRITASNQAVLVDRGFIPMVDNQPGDLGTYAQPGEVTVRGILRLPYVPRYFGVPDPTLAPGQSRLAAWNSVNLPRIQKQTAYSLLPVYVEVAPATAQTAEAQLTTAPVYPIAVADQPDLTEGPHLGYAFQWFSFAAVFAIGYLYFIKQQFSAAQKSLTEKLPEAPVKAEQK
jgi:surfeit locus 1 family protein